MRHGYQGYGLEKILDAFVGNEGSGIGNYDTLMGNSVFFLNSFLRSQMIKHTQPCAIKKRRHLAFLA